MHFIPMNTHGAYAVLALPHTPCGQSSRQAAGVTVPSLWVAMGDQGRDSHGTSVAKPGPDLGPSYIFTKVNLSEHFRELQQTCHWFF